MADTVVARLLEQAKKRPEMPAFYVKEHGIWSATSWKGYAEQVRRAARAMMALGFEPGQKAGILGFNRAEWVLFDVAAIAAGGAPAGIYTTCSPEEVAYILKHAEAPIVLLENESQWAKVEEVLGELPDLRWAVMMKGTEVAFTPEEGSSFQGVLGWEAFLSRAEEVQDEDLDARIEALEPEGLATLIYTSGTTGPPKGVMLSNENLAWTSRIVAQVIDMGPSDRGISYLPLSHIAEQMLTIHGPITAGSSIYFAESIEKVADNLKEASPTVFFGVPRIWEKFHAAITAKLQEAEGPKKMLVDWARGVATKANALKVRGEEPAGLLGIQHALAQKLVFTKLKKAIGLGDARVMVSGAAPIAKEVLEFFASLDLIVQEVYGQSEDCGPTSLNLVGRTKFGSVGPALPGVQVKIADDEEILVKGPNVFSGYYKDEETTKATLSEEGWLHSGDLGRFDEEGFLFITGRKKDIIITAGGKNITPKNLESAIKNSALITEAVVIGDRRKYLSAVVTLEEEAATEWMKARGLSGAPHECKALSGEILRWVREEVNPHFARVEQIKKIAVLPRQLTIEDGELTPTLKVKRARVAEHFAEQIEALYAD